jgi:hypothetical protein
VVPPESPSCGSSLIIGRRRGTGKVALRAADPDHLTPMEALARLKELKDRFASK